MASNLDKKGPGGHYSGANPIPNIQRFVESLDVDKKERNKKINEQMQGKSGGEAVDHVNAQKSKAPESRKLVTDPVTGKQVTIEDVNKDFMKAVDYPQLSVPNANLGKETTAKTEPTQSGVEYRRNQDITAPPDPVEPGSTSDVPIHGEKANILFHPTPSISYGPLYEALEKKATILAAGIVVAIVVLGNMFGCALYGLIPLAMCVASGVFLWMKGVVRSGRELEWESEKTRGQHVCSGTIYVADTVEDVMQASVPGVIEDVQVAEINQRNNSFRILSLRALPDGHVQELKDDIHMQNEQNKDPQELAADEEGGDYYNLECSFSYHAKPSSGNTSEKAKNMHMQLTNSNFRRASGAGQDPLTFTLMGLPKVQAGCVPMIQTGINFFNLPLISNFVNYAIAPKSMTLDMGKLLQGDKIQKETEAIGILWIRIHRASGLSKQDRRGSKGGGSDPYITVSFSKYGKPMYYTRVIQDNLNLVWEETCALLVTPGLIKVDEQLSMELWYSDRSTSDDVVGKVELSMQKMIQHPGKMYPQNLKLRGMDENSSMPGELHWEVGYFGNSQFRPALRIHGKDVNLPDQLKDHAAFQNDKGTLGNATEDAVVHTPPDPLWPSGICSVIVHQIVHIELHNMKESNGKRKGRKYEPAAPASENKEEEHKDLPSGYCTILFNDKLVYRTRTKVVSSKPIFNAGTERFMHDWRSAIITVTVRDQRMRQHDPILGVVLLKLSDILQTSSQVTRWYPLDGGIGFGRIRISILWRSVETRLPPQQLGWDVGTFEFTSDQIPSIGYNSTANLKMRTGRTQCKKTDEGDGIYRYRSPIVFEFHTASKRSADAYAIIWLHHLEDNKEEGINNFKDIPDIAIEDIGRLRFRGRFKAGTDEARSKFITDNDSRETQETQETWEACHSEGVHETIVTKGMPPAVQELHDQSLTQGRDVLSQADEKEKKKWLSKGGTDWSGAFGQDPAQYAGQGGYKKSSANGTSSAANGESRLTEDMPEASDNEEEDESDSSSDLGIHDAENDNEFADEKTNGDGAENVLKSAHSKNSIEQYRDNQKGLHRKQKGLMQWKPMRNLQFAKDETKFVVKRTIGKPV
ncbi:probable meiotically up-regulated gene 190 protein [Phialocephala subalpina]|uniref:Probable meiotically up-regulated gene 190 protein n=1 Tax=Phialocephala subalpina TaxID=576137 RepID=A0A1L7WKB9_9HELO|nr:probable meiotically up-regulated gene 190 protein [Phialocephala subalpina]